MKKQGRSAKLRQHFSLYFAASDGCYNLGVLYKEGAGMRRDEKTAKECFQKTCYLGDQEGYEKS
jgi:hypothetical protein